MVNRLSARATAIAFSLVAMLGLCMAICAMPAWAADDSVAVKVGDTTTVTSTLAYDSATQHIDYTVADSAIAQVNKHKGVVTGIAAGTTTVTAHVVNKAYVSGGGTGDSGLCADEDAAKTQSWTVTVSNATAAYGLQGTGGLSIKMLDPQVTSVSGNNESGYTNEIGTPIEACSHGIVTFTYSQDGALNNGLDTYLTNSASDIYVTAAGSSEKLATLAKTGSLTASINASASTVTLMLDTAALKGASTGVLHLDKGIKNNGGNKTVGVDLAFPFSVGGKVDKTVTDAAVEATTTQFGKTEGSHCGVCGKVIVAQEQVLKLQEIAVKTTTLAAKKGKKSTKKIAVSAPGALSFKKVSGKSGITLVKVSGGFAIKAAKSMKPGTYSIKVAITAAGTSEFQPAAAKTITVKVKVTK